MDITQKLYKLASSLEKKGYNKLAYKIPALKREINAASAKDEGVIITDWSSFLTWWGENRGQNLKYVFTDTFGADSEEVQQVSELLEEANTHEENLHKFYMLLKKKAKEQKASPAKEEGEKEEVLKSTDEDLELKPEPNADLGEEEGLEDLEEPETKKE